MSLDGRALGEAPPARRVVDAPRRVAAKPPLWRRAVTNSAVLTGLVWVVAEIVGAIRPGGDDTLSDWTWDVLGEPYGLRWHVILGALAGLGIWTWCHFAFRAWGFDVPELLVLTIGCALIGCGLHLVR